MNMRNTMTVDGYQAVITFDPDIHMFRGEFLGLNGGADFYARDVEGLQREGRISLEVFLAACAEDGVEPIRKINGWSPSARANPSAHPVS
jgi:predicted HicB family RNase H-like nuclease